MPVAPDVDEFYRAFLVAADLPTDIDGTVAEFWHEKAEIAYYVAGRACMRWCDFADDVMSFIEDETIPWAFVVREQMEHLVGRALHEHEEAVIAQTCMLARDQVAATISSLLTSHLGAS